MNTMSAAVRAAGRAGTGLGAAGLLAAGVGAAPAHADDLVYVHDAYHTYTSQADYTGYQLDYTPLAAADGYVHAGLYPMTPAELAAPLNVEPVPGLAEALYRAVNRARVANGLPPDPVDSTREGWENAKALAVELNRAGALVTQSEPWHTYGQVPTSEVGHVRVGTARDHADTVITKPAAQTTAETADAAALAYNTADTGPRGYGYMLAGRFSGSTTGTEVAIIGWGGVSAPDADLSDPAALAAIAADCVGMWLNSPRHRASLLADHTGMAMSAGVAVDAFPYLGHTGHGLYAEVSWSALANTTGPVGSFHINPVPAPVTASPGGGNATVRVRCCAGSDDPGPA